MSESSRPATGGPPLPLVAGITAALFVASLVVGFTAAQPPFPSPFDEPSVRSAAAAAGADVLQVSAFLQFASAVPLAVLAASLFARLQHLGVRAAGAAIALVGGVLAAAFLALSAGLLWAISRTAPAGPPAVVLVLQDLAFATGGPAHVVGLGLLVAGVAVPGLLLGLLPRWLAVAGLVIAVVAELSTLTLLLSPAAVLLPLARFPALVWLIGAAVVLPHHRRAAPRRGTSRQGTRA